ncbi:ABC transporter ATP-binding protein [Clostridioides difficile]|uniref:ABC transporter ATP-binding protein n=1 Tax=Clostridioides difficile TaxID=1496 RepID=UPI000D1D87B7|nr:ABC transporter ATP-binding protein [Clostridioides difficile]MDL5065741.1 ABC transporter ATP-binding protein [Clostridioides difficile]MDN9455133.1 ABC transporter ATP-binding protein [Clostridioides difficile]HBF7900020.1 ABC transporter ATP-binding protein [Clostridioides difficile]
MEIKINNISVVIKGKHIFSNITDTMNSGDIVALTGASGCGKTTLLNCLGLIQPIESGSILINQKDTSKWNDKDKTKFWHKYATFIYQDYGIIEDESVAYNITLDKTKVKSRAVKDILEKVGLKGRDKEQAIVLSGGEKQRIGIARAILKNASIIYADEPTASLDFENRQIVITLLKECASNGAIVILATHDDRLVKECSKVIDMSKL